MPGPGEFGGANLWQHFGTGDTLFVLDGMDLNVFSPNMAWQRSFRLPDNFHFALFADRDAKLLHEF